jgi:hypothetical protein
MFMFVISLILAAEGRLAVIEPIVVEDNLTIEQCVERMESVPSNARYEVRCVLVGEKI